MPSLPGAAEVLAALGTAPTPVDELVRRCQVSAASVAEVLLALELEDAHQEAFVRAFSPQHRQAYDGLRPYLGYLCVIGRSAAIDVLRRRGKVVQNAIAVDDADSGVAQLALDAPTPEEAALKAELQGVIQGFLATLDPLLQQLAQLRFVEGMAQEAAAAQLKLTRSEVRTREQRVRQALVKYLEARGYPQASVAAALVLLTSGALVSALLSSSQGGSHGLV